MEISVDWIKAGHLQSLGITEIHICVFLVILGLLISYRLLVPLFEWFVLEKLTKVMSYIVSSFLIVMLFLLYIVYTNHVPLYLLKITLQTVSLFGLSLVLFYLFKRVKKKVFANK